jgi:hypothetical protein
VLRDPEGPKGQEAHPFRSFLSAEVDLRGLCFVLEWTCLAPKGRVELVRDRPKNLRDLLIVDTATLQERNRLDFYITDSFRGPGTGFSSRVWTSASPP